MNGDSIMMVLVLTVCNSTFVNNSANYYGGAIFNYGSRFTLCGKRF